MKAITVIIISLLVFWVYQSIPVSEDDIYVDKLVYLKKDSSLFSGKLKVSDKASYYYENFCDGIPCGEWAEHQRGGSYVARGEYLLVKENLSESTLQMISDNIVVIDYWQEGGDLPSDPYHLSVFILKDNTFFHSDEDQYEGYIEQLANAVFNDTRNLKYKYFSIFLVNAVRDWSKNYHKEYELINGKLKEISKE